MNRDAAEEPFFNAQLVIPFGGDMVEDAHGLPSHFRTDAVSRQNQNIEFHDGELLLSIGWEVHPITV
jgi:hypothetical protein